MNLKSSTFGAYYRGMKHAKIAFLALAGAALLGGCATPSKPSIGRPATAVVEAKPEKGLPPGLTDRIWTVSGFNTGSQFVPLEPGHGSDAWVRFASDGTLAGYTGTNNFTGTWKLGGKNAKGTYPLAVNLGGMTRKAAINEIAARFELTFIEDLTKSSALTPGKDALDLTDSSGAKRLSFVFLKGTQGQ